MDLEQALVKLNSIEDANVLLDVLLTPRELEELRHRWKGCLMTLDGKTQRTICAELHVGNATASRCAQAVRKAPPRFSDFVNAT